MDCQLNIIGIEERTARQHIVHISHKSRRVHRHKHFVLFPPGQEAILADPDGIPGRQALNIGWKQVFTRNRDSHLKQRTQNGQVGGLAAGAVHRRHSDREIVDHRFLRRRRILFENWFCRHCFSLVIFYIPNNIIFESVHASHTIYGAQCSAREPVRLRDKKIAPAGRTRPI